jgi:beta propeller domain-containing protein
MNLLFRIYLFRLALATLFLGLGGCISIKQPNTELLSHSTLKKFDSEVEFDDYINSVKKLKDYRHKKYQAEQDDFDCEEEGCRKITITGSRITGKNTSITNNQVSGVDEGDIVKRKDNFLLILRRGKIYSVSLKSDGQNELTPVSSINVTPPGWNFDSWYDEMLIEDNKILVLGYSYELEASEILRFNISDKGVLSYQDGYLLSSGDYFDTENYASRLFNGKYITYMPSPLADYDNPYAESRSFLTGLPRIAKISGTIKESLVWTDLISFEEIYKPTQLVISPILHTILSCDPLAEELICDAKGIISSASTEYYVDQGAIYLWAQGWKKDILFDLGFYDNIDFTTILSSELKYVEDLDAVVYKIPFNQGEITAIRVNGQPINQFSFHSIKDKLYMYLIDDVYSDTTTRSSLYELPFDWFNPEASNQASKIAELPHTYLEVNNRFSNDYLVTGSRTNISWSRDSGRDLIPDFDLIVQKIDGSFQTVLTLEHSADRMEPIGNRMLVSGLDLEGNYNISILELENHGELISRKVFTDLLEDELRSHAFNLKIIDDFLAIVGLTSLNKKDAENRYGAFNYYWNDNQASDILFLSLNSVGQLSTSGILKSELNNTPDSDSQECETSCYDWYGNSRPFFIEDRIFGLSGDELIEAKLDGTFVVEKIRKNFTNIAM